MKFSKYNNPNRRKVRRPSPYSQKYIEDRRKELQEALAKCENDFQRECLIKAFDVSIRP